MNNQIQRPFQVTLRADLTQCQRYQGILSLKELGARVFKLKKELEGPGAPSVGTNAHQQLVTKLRYTEQHLDLLMQLTHH